MQSRDPLTSPRSIAVVAAIVVAHLAALIGLASLRNTPEQATIEPTTFTATIIPLTPPAPTPPAPAPKPQPEPPKPKVAPPPKPRTEPPKNAITPKPEPVAPPAPAEPVQNATPTPPAPPAPAPTPAPAPSGPVVGLAVKCDEPRTVYPSQSRRAGEEGQVTLRIIIDQRGVVSTAEVIKSSGFPRLDQAARTAALAMRCAPPMQGGRAVEAAATKPFNFNLN